MSDYKTIEHSTFTFFPKKEFDIKELLLKIAHDSKLKETKFNKEIQIVLTIKEKDLKCD